MQATAKDLRFHVKKYLETVSRGEEVIITYRGKACAKLIPYGDEVAQINEENELFGIWQDDPESENVEGYVRHLRSSRFHVD